MRRRRTSRSVVAWTAVALGLAMATTGAIGVTAAGATTARVAPAAAAPRTGDPCRFLLAAAVESAVGITDPDGPSPFGSTTNRCVYGQPFGLHFQITEETATDGGRYAKSTCAAAKAAKLFTGYVRVRGLGTNACRFTTGSKPTMVVVVPAGSRRRAVRVLTLAVSGTPTQMYPIAGRIDAGLQTLAEQAVAAASVGTG